MITTCDSFLSLETGMVFVQAANEAAAKKRQTSPVAIRFNWPRFLQAFNQLMIPRLKQHSSS
jgi:hypothetical protein